mmetsp:Transcript_663/g.1242  ORF Transcript_663/g.1242 Transcript_663/m.1242 type:complete len:224 (+) Transcript_663:3-674(+)
MAKGLARYMFEEDEGEFDGALREKSGRPAMRRRRRDKEVVEDDDGPPPEEMTKKTGGWGMGGDTGAAAAAKHGRRQGGSTTQGVTEFSPDTDTAPAPRGQRQIEDDDDVPVIPDLEEVEEEDITRQVADAPVARPVGLPTDSDLDKGKGQLPPANVDGINLTVLYDCLIAPDALTEKDEYWDPDTMLSELKAEIQAEEDRLADDGEKKEDDGPARPEAGGGVR